MVPCDQSSHNMCRKNLLSPCRLWSKTPSRAHPNLRGKAHWEVRRTLREEVQPGWRPLSTKVLLVAYMGYIGVARLLLAFSLAQLTYYAGVKTMSRSCMEHTQSSKSSGQPAHQRNVPHTLTFSIRSLRTRATHGGTAQHPLKQSCTHELHSREVIGV